MSDLPAKFIEEESWLHQPGETNAAYHTFYLYRDYGGDRSIKKVLIASNTPIVRPEMYASMLINLEDNRSFPGRSQAHCSGMHPFWQKTTLRMSLRFYRKNRRQGFDLVSG